MIQSDERARDMVEPVLIGRLFDAHAPALVLYARQLCDDPEAAVQQAFMKLAEQSHAPKEPTAWLFRTTRNEALMAVRAARRRRRRETEAAQNRSQWFRSADAQKIDAHTVARAMASLPSDQREIVAAHIWGGLSFQSIGEVVGISSSAAHRRYQSALATLRKGIGEP